MRFIVNGMVLTLVIAVSSCKNVARYAIDDKPVVKIDRSLLGIWKAAEDSNKNNFIFVQSSEDNFARFQSRYSNPGNNPLEQDMYNQKVNEHKQKGDYCYYITYFKNGGMRFQEWSTFLSVIGKETFLNVGEPGSPLNGFVFVRIISITYDKMTVAAVADTTLRYLNSAKEVRSRIEKNLYSPAFYKDTLHFHRVNFYHASLDEAWAESKKKLRD